MRVGSGDLNMQCRNCRKQNPEDANFCNGCGARLPVEATVAIGERRQLTVVFCDVVKSTPLVKFLDPEEWQEITGAYYDACETVICRHDGYVAEKQGDG
jgi:class 3 adenylate cyclase